MDDHINIRPYALAICFAWGLICGFLFHTFSSAEPKKDPPPKKITDVKKTDPEIKKGSLATTMAKLVPLDSGTPPPPHVEELITQATKAENTQKEPTWNISDSPDSPIPLRIDWGLTGASAPLPKAKTSLGTPGPTPPNSKRTREWTTSDDPELVF